MTADVVELMISAVVDPPVVCMIVEVGAPVGVPLVTTVVAFDGV